MNGQNQLNPFPFMKTLSADRVDPAIIRKILKEDIAARELILQLPGLTEGERMRHGIFITQAKLHRLDLKADLHFGL